MLCFKIVVMWNVLSESYETRRFPSGGSAKYDLCICSVCKSVCVVNRKQVKLGLGICKECSPSHRDLVKEGKLEKLLDLTNSESCYWLGFLMADGHFSKQGRLKLKVAKKDEDHLLRFLSFLGLTYHIHKDKEAVVLYIKDRKTLPLLKEKFGVTNNKTYNPCDISLLCESKEVFMPFLLGFIDGDGWVIMNGPNRIRIGMKVHSSWLSNLDQFAIKLAKYSGNSGSKAYIDGCGYANLNITKGSTIKFLFLQSRDLPVLKRKWDKIKEVLICQNFM